MLTALILVLLGLLWLGIVRNTQVYQERTRVAAFLFRQADWERLLPEYERIGYTRMVVQFWTPVRAFFARTVLGDRMASPAGALRVRTHHPDQCQGRHCCVHNPSPHHMRDWPLNWRADRRLMERICPHGVGHPDPDHLAYARSVPYRQGRYDPDGTHGCDGCCCPPEERP